MESQHSTSAPTPSFKRKKEEDREDWLADLEQEEAVVQFPYMEFTRKDSITCPCQATGYILTELQLKIPYVGPMTQSSLETNHYVDCDGANSTAV